MCSLLLALRLYAIYPIGVGVAIYNICDLSYWCRLVPSDDQGSRFLSKSIFSLTVLSLFAQCVVGFRTRKFFCFSIEALANIGEN